MRNIVSQRGGSDRSGFVRVPQAEDEDTEQPRFPGRARFTHTVQHDLRQSSSATYSSSEQSSPSLSETSVTSQDYLSLPIQQFDEVDLADAPIRCAELGDYSGPEVVESDFASDTENIKAGKGIEVHIRSYPLEPSPDDLDIDDHEQELGYQGSRGITEKPAYDHSPPYNYRPAPLRWRFILIVFAGLVALLILFELALRLLPDATDMEDILPIFQNVSEIREKAGDLVERRGLFNEPIDEPEYYPLSGVTTSFQVDRSVGTSSSTMSSSTASIPLGPGTTSPDESNSTTTIPSTPKVTPSIETTDMMGTTSSVDVASSTETTSVTEPTTIAEISETTSIVETTSTTDTASLTQMTSSPQATSTSDAFLTTETISTTDYVSTKNTIPATDTISFTETFSTTNTALTTAILGSTSTAETPLGTDTTSTSESSLPTDTSGSSSSSDWISMTYLPSQTASYTQVPVTDTVSANRTEGQNNQPSMTPSQIPTILTQSSHGAASSGVHPTSPGSPLQNTTNPQQAEDLQPLTLQGGSQDSVAIYKAMFTSAGDLLDSTPSPTLLLQETGSPDQSKLPPNENQVQDGSQKHQDNTPSTLNRTDRPKAQQIAQAEPQQTHKATSFPPDQPASKTPDADGSGTFPSHAAETPAKGPAQDSNVNQEEDPTNNKPADQVVNHPPGITETRQLMSQATGQATPDESGPISQPTSQAKDDPINNRPGGQQVQPNNDSTGVVSQTTDNIQPAITSSPTGPRDGAMRISNAIGMHSAVHSDEQDDRRSSVTQLPGHPEQNAGVKDKPFTTLTLTQETETAPSPITTVVTTSSSISGSGIVQVTMMTTIYGHVKAADPLTDFTTTTTYANGTVATITESVYDSIWTTVEPDVNGEPQTKYVHVLNSAQMTTLRDSLGFATATLKYYEVESVVTLYDDKRIPTATMTSIIHETTRWTTLYDTSGSPTRTTLQLWPISTNTAATPTSTPSSTPGSNEQPTLELRRLSDGIYFIGLMLPTLLAILIFIPIKILNRNVRLYQGFHALASERGAGAAESLLLRTTGPVGVIDGLLSLRRGEYLSGLTSILVVLSAFNVPLSTEVFRLILRGSQCRSDGSSEMKCSVALGVFHAPAQILLALLITLIICFIIVAVLLRRWRTGVESNPWSIWSMAQLATGTDMLKVFKRLRRHRRAGKRVDTKAYASNLHGKTFCLSGWDENGVAKYSVLVRTQRESMAESPINKAGRSVRFDDSGNSRWGRCLCWSGRIKAPFFMLSWAGRMLFLLSLSGVLIAVLTYDNVARGSEYQRGLTGKAIGIRFLFSGAGILITSTWGSFFDAVAFLSPYQQLQRRRPSRAEAIYISPATNPFAGLWLAFVPSRRDPYLGVVSMAAIVSEFLPLYLGNIPCNGVQLEFAETVNVYLSVAVLIIMMFIVGASFLIDWATTMGVDPSTLAGAMYNAHVLSVEQPLRLIFKDKLACSV